MIRARYQSDTAFAGKHRGIDTAINMSDERPSPRRHLSEWWAMANLLRGHRSLRSRVRALFSLSGGVDGHAATGRASSALTFAGRQAGQPRRTFGIGRSDAAGIKPGPLTLFLIDLAMGMCFNVIVLMTVCEILGWRL